MIIPMNNGHPIHSIDGLAMEVDAAAGMVEVISNMVKTATEETDQESIEDAFFSVSAFLHRISTDLFITFETMSRAEAAAEQKKAQGDYMNIPER